MKNVRLTGRPRTRMTVCVRTVLKRSEDGPANCSLVDVRVKVMVGTKGT